MRAPRLSPRSITALAAAGIALSGALVLSCRYDPVPQEIIDDLGDDYGSGADHRAGQPCLACHSAYAQVAPQMTFGGTVYTKDPDGNIIPASGVTVAVFDSAGDSRLSCSRPSGNFYLEKKDWKEVEFPLTVKAGSKRMRSLVGRDGSCGSCHKVPDPENAPERDPVTGEGHDSAGMIFVDFADTGKCGSTP